LCHVSKLIEMQADRLEQVCGIGERLPMPKA
jgi:hypothetical protein